MKLWAATLAIVATFGSAAADEITCNSSAQSRDEFVACEGKKFHDSAKAQAEAYRAARDAGKRLGDWLQFNEPDQNGTRRVIEATATSIQDATITLNLKCSERSGFQLTIRGKSSLGVPRRTTAYILIDGRPPIEMAAIQLVPEIDLPALQIGHSEPIERQIIKSNSIQIRYDTRYGGSSSYTFKFAGLTAGEKIVTSMCPAP